MDDIFYHAVQDMEGVAGLPTAWFMLSGLSLADIAHTHGVRAITAGPSLPICRER